MNRLTGKSYSNASGGNCASIAANTPSVSYTYDQGTNGIGRRTSMSDGSGSTNWTYDNRGRVIEEIKSITGVGSFKTVTTYNSADLLDSIQYPDNNSNAISAERYFLYYPQLSLKEFKYTSSLSYVKDIQYDAAGRITTRTLGNNLVLTNNYKDWDDQGGRLDTLLAIQGQWPVQNLEYTYDAVGNITQIRDHVAEIYPIEWQDQDFSYDALNRLVTASATGGPADGGYSESYTYDANTGNLTSKAGTSYTYNDTNHDHAVTHLGGVQKYWYDANGNQVTRIVGSDTYNLSYDAENRLVEVKKNNITITTFVYDGDENRAKSTLGTTTTGYIGDHTEWKVGAASQPTRYYNAGGMRLATWTGGVMYYPLTDHLGSTTMTTDASGYEVAEIRYKAWGESRYSWNTTPTKHQYTGQYSNVGDFGLMYYKARWYDSALSRWTQPDTVIPDNYYPSDWDRYNFVRSNPIRWNDPSGHKACTPTIDGGCDTLEEDIMRFLDIVDKLSTVEGKDHDNDGLPETPDKNYPPVQIGSTTGCNQSTYVECFYNRDLLKITKKTSIDKRQLALLMIAVSLDIQKRFTNGWDRSRYDTPFWDGYGSAPGQACFGSHCFARQEVNYFAQGMYSAEIGESVTQGEQAVEDWKSLMYRESPSTGTMIWFDVGYLVFMVLAGR